jgi:hypothetical protein
LTPSSASLQNDFTNSLDDLKYNYSEIEIQIDQNNKKIIDLLLLQKENRLYINKYINEVRELESKNLELRNLLINLSQ